MNDIKFSIITANYNGFVLMKRYFNCLHKQSYKNFEVIIIDDCSTDNSFDELIRTKELLKNEFKISVYKTKKNSGPGNARNIGIAKATGDYITFVDNDDWIDFDCLETVNKIIKQKSYDCIIYDYSLDNDNSRTVIKSLYGDFNGIVLKKDVLKYIRNHTVCKFYKKKIIEENNITFPNIKRHEDIAFVGSAVVKCDSFYYIDKPMYHYVQYKKSLSNQNDLDEKTLFIAYEIVKKNYGHIYKDEFKEKSVMDFLYSTVLVMCKNNCKSKKIKTFIKNYERDNKEWWKADIINRIGLFKKVFLYFVRLKFILFLRIVSKIHTIIVKG